MEHEIEVPELTAFQGAQQVHGFDIVFEPERCQITPFLVLPQVIADGDPFTPPPIERPHERAAYETGAASDKNTGAGKVTRSKVGGQVMRNCMLQRAL